MTTKCVASWVAEAGGFFARETLHSHLLKSNCPVTRQPDWGSVLIRTTHGTNDDLITPACCAIWSPFRQTMLNFQ